MKRARSRLDQLAKREGTGHDTVEMLIFRSQKGTKRFLLCLRLQKMHDVDFLSIGTWVVSKAGGKKKRARVYSNRDFKERLDFVEVKE